MPELSRAQLVVYAALAAVALMLGLRWIRSGGEDASASPAAGQPFAPAAGEAIATLGLTASGGASFTVMSTGIDVAIAPALSVTTAVRE